MSDFYTYFTETSNGLFETFEHSEMRDGIEYVIRMEREETYEYPEGDCYPGLATFDRHGANVIRDGGVDLDYYLRRINAENYGGWVSQAEGFARWVRMVGGAVREYHDPNKNGHSLITFVLPSQWEEWGNTGPVPPDAAEDPDLEADLNGEVYFLTLEVEGEEVDSCGDIYGNGYAVQTAREWIDHHQKMATKNL